MMDISIECVQAPALVTDIEKSVSVEDTEWDQTHQLPDKGYVSVLLDISEEISFKEQEPFEYLCLSGWEQAIHGWGRAPPLSCLFQPQRRGKKAKTIDPAPVHHCLLCVDLKLCEPMDTDSSTVSSESCSEPTTEDYSNIAYRHTPVPYSQHSAASHSTCSLVFNPHLEHEAPVSPGLSTLRKATEQLSLRDQLVEDEGGQLCELNECPSLHESSAAPSQPHYPGFANCPDVTDLGVNTRLIINSFAVLPPVKVSPTRHARTPSLSRRAEAPADHSGDTVEAGSDVVTPAGESKGVERGEEMRADNVPEDTYPKALTSKYWTSRQSHHLLSTFSLPVPKRFTVPLGSLTDPLPRATYPMGRHSKQELRTGSGHRLFFGLRHKNPTRVEPQLPILLGTRVQIPASAHRLL